MKDNFALRTNMDVSNEVKEIKRSKRDDIVNKDSLMDSQKPRETTAVNAINVHRKNQSLSVQVTSFSKREFITGHFKSQNVVSKMSDERILPTIRCARIFDRFQVLKYSDIWKMSQHLCFRFILTTTLNLFFSKKSFNLLDEKKTTQNLKTSTKFRQQLTVFQNWIFWLWKETYFSWKAQNS